MEFQKTNDKEHPHKLTFGGSEPETVRAAYREYLYQLALKGNTGSISDYEVHIAGWEDGEEPRSILPNSYETVVTILEDFAEHTDEVIQRIPEETGVPAYQSEDIAERHALGKRALQLAQEIRDTVSATVLEDAVEVTDEAITRWLSEDQK